MRQEADYAFGEAFVPHRASEALQEAERFVLSIESMIREK